MSKDDLDSDLRSFLASHGVSLSDFGSSEFGLKRADAMTFLGLLFRVGKMPLGIEVWRHRGKKFSIDSLGGWYSENTSYEVNCNLAKDFVGGADLTDDDLVTIQFD